MLLKLKRLQTFYAQMQSHYEQKEKVSMVELLKTDNF